MQGLSVFLSDVEVLTNFLSLYTKQNSSIEFSLSSEFKSSRNIWFSDFEE